MKSKDIVLLSNLRANARESLTRMSRKTSIPVSTIFDRLKIQERTVIKKHTAIIDFAKIGFGTRVTLTLKVAKDHKIEVKDYLMSHYNVNSIYKINNGFDYLLEGIFRDIRELEEFLETLDDKFKIKQKQIYYIVEDLKREDFLADPNTSQLVIA